MSNQCTYEIFTEGDATIESHHCGRPVSFILTNADGRNYPRCRRHCSEKVQAYAKDHNYTIQSVDPTG